MKIYAQNKKAKFEYEFVNTFEAGIMLEGGEVKSVRTNHIYLNESYVKIEKDELWLTKCHITVPSYIPDYLRFDEKRDKKLLMHKKEIMKLKSKVKEKGLTLLIYNIYQPTDSTKIKCTLVLARGKKTYDKSKSIKEKDIKRDFARELKNYK